MKFLHMLFVQLMLLSKLRAIFYSGRIKPGKFEYPKLNGRMPIWQAVEKCEENIACAGFTFKGSYRSAKTQMEIYFFHLVILSNTQSQTKTSSLKEFVQRFNYLPLKFSYLQNNLENDIPKKEAHYYNWSTYQVERDYIHITHMKVKSKLQHSKQMNNDKQM